MYRCREKNQRDCFRSVKSFNQSAVNRSSCSTVNRKNKHSRNDSERNGCVNARGISRRDFLRPQRYQMILWNVDHTSARMRSASWRGAPLLVFTSRVAACDRLTNEQPRCAAGGSEVTRLRLAKLPVPLSRSRRERGIAASRPKAAVRPHGGTVTPRGSTRRQCGVVVPPVLPDVPVVVVPPLCEVREPVPRVVAAL